MRKVTNKRNGDGQEVGRVRVMETRISDVHIVPIRKEIDNVPIRKGIDKDSLPLLIRKDWR